MKQVWIPRPGPPEVLELREAPDPQPGEGEVRVAVAAAGVNFADLLARMGIYPDAPPLPCVVGYEIAGTIDAVGPGVAADRLGEQVVGMCRFGGYSSAVVLPAERVLRRPEGLDAVTAAAIPVTGLTAWMMLEELGRVRAGDRVLVHAAGGGVGLMALDLILRRGAHPIGTASPGKHEALRERGYRQLIDYRSRDFYEVLRDEPGLDLILDPIGGASWGKGLRLLRPGGRLICFGFSSGATADTRSPLALLRFAASVPWLRVNPLALMNENIGVMGVNMGRLWGEGERVTSWLHMLLELWRIGELRPVIHAALPFERAAEAHRLIHNRENLGKVVLTSDPE